DGDAHGGDARVGLAVIGLVGEAVGAVVVGRRDVAEAAVAVQRQAAVCGLAHQHRTQGVAVHVAVVDQHAGRGHVQGRVFSRGVAVVDSHRRVVHACDGDAHRGNARVGLAVISLVGEAVGAVVVEL